MRRTAVTGAAVAIVVAAVAATVTSAAPSGQRGERVEVIRSSTEETSRAFQDLDNSGGPSPGDRVVLASDIRQDGRVIGYNVAEGTMTRVIGQRILFNFWGVTVLRRGGEFTTHGVFDSANGAGPHRLAITGGTGRYRRARGDVVYHVSDNGTRSTAVTRLIY